MNRLFLILFISSLLISFVLDRPKLRKAPTPEKWIYGALMIIAGGLGLMSVVQVRLPMPTTWVVNEVVPAIQRYMMH